MIIILKKPISLSRKIGQQGTASLRQTKRRGVFLSGKKGERSMPKKGMDEMRDQFKLAHGGSAEKCEASGVSDRSVFSSADGRLRTENSSVVVMENCARRAGRGHPCGFEKTPWPSAERGWNPVLLPKSGFIRWKSIMGIFIARCTSPFPSRRTKFARFTGRDF